MSDFKRGDRVVISNGRGEGVVQEVTHSGHEVFVKIDGSFSSLWYYHENLTKIVDPPVSLVGKRVKLTLGESVVVGKVHPTTRENPLRAVMLEVEGEVVRSFSMGLGWTLEVLREPIVLPTKSQALISLNRGHAHDAVFRISAKGWRSGNGTYYAASEVQEIAEEFRDTYRVIFEGE